MIEEILLGGAITDLPVIFCRNEEVAIYLQSWMHTHLTKEPPITVLDDWPDGVEAGALAVTPIHVLSSRNPLTFRINIVPKLKEDTKKVLNAAIRLSIAGKECSVRNLAAASFGTTARSSKRQIDYALRELEENGLIMRVDERTPPKLTFGRWRPDPAAAKAADRGPIPVSAGRSTWPCRSGRRFRTPDGR